MKRFLKIFFSVILIAVIVAAIVLSVFNLIVFATTNSKVYTEDTAQNLSADCIIVLGCSVYIDGTPSPFLKDRVTTAVNLYKQGVAPKILMSGDHGQDDYNEVAVMRDTAMELGVPEEDIYMDHAGFSTYETMYRASEIFGIENAVIVTQGFHIHRAVYDAKALGINAKGVKAQNSGYVVLAKNYVREFLARVKDFFYCIAKPEPTYLGDPIDITGDGRVTNDV